ncbi:MAG TPA: CDP-diacylglycerol--serine O-phosphatidyltransferase [Gammaproteobacteria bacterium]|nr:CDP-diacylglycerol--serine O-phosphatidyltransferase [Gammaproteobacteria bacterium]
MKENDFAIFNKRFPRRGIYLLPNLLTTIGLFAGFYAVVAGMKGRFETAAIAMFIAMIADGLDGRVARLTNTQSDFGAQYDSMSDMLSFGITPSLVVYSWSLSYLGKMGWVIAFLYTAATALRLARFNTQVHETEVKQYSQGLTCTAAAGMIASTIWLGSQYVEDGRILAIPVGILTTLVAAFMVSTIRYHVFKKIDLKGKVPFITAVVAVFVIAAIALEPPEILFAIAFIYVFSGPVITFWQKRRIRKRSSK